MGAPPPGTILAGKYRVERVLGEGGMGVVVLATHLELEQPVALKFMLPNVLASDEARARFKREARAAARLRSEHVARVLDVGQFEDGSPYIVMEFLEGADLGSMLAQRGSLPIPEAVAYLLQAAEGLAEAHAAGIVHRDIKPGNLFVTHRLDGSPIVKILDFGISKAAPSGQGSDPALTGTRVVMGSPQYMSPEQVTSARRADARTDVWALGVVLYEIIAGRTPFQADSPGEVWVQILRDPPPPMRAFRIDVPPALEAVIFRCLEKTPEQRMGSVAELAAALVPFGPPEGAQGAGRTARLLGGPAAAASAGFSSPLPVASPPAPTPPPQSARVKSTMTAASGEVRSPRERPARRWPVAIGLLAGTIAIGAAVVIGVGLTLREPAPVVTPAAVPAPQPGPSPPDPTPPEPEPVALPPDAAPVAARAPDAAPVKPVAAKPASKPRPRRPPRKPSSQEDLYDER